MGSMMPWHLFLILFILLCPVVGLGVVIWLVSRTAGRNRRP